MKILLNEICGGGSFNNMLYDFEFSFSKDMYIDGDSYCGMI